MNVAKKIEHIDLKKLKEYSICLSREVSNRGYTPENILYIERAGLFIAHELANTFGCGISGIYASRSGSLLKSYIKIVLRNLPQNVTNLLRVLEEKSKIHAIKKDRNVYIEKSLPPKGKNILIVDDAIDTGNSMKSVVNFLVSEGYNINQIKSAVLTTTRKSPVYEPDIALFRNVSFAFPWSYDSNEYDVTWKLYDRIKSLISF